MSVTNLVHTHVRTFLCVSTCISIKLAQLCPTLCDLMDHTVHGIL